MKRPITVRTWDIPDTMQVPDGYHCKSVPELTHRNMEYVIEQHNKLVECVQSLMEHLNITAEGEE